MVVRHIRKALAATGGRVEGTAGAARLLGLHPSTLRGRMKKLGIPYGRHLKASSRIRGAKGDARKEPRVPCLPSRP
ncbi:MAG: helix-turn-helix domain-containing protein [Desulfobacteraceae bacterium]